MTEAFENVRELLASAVEALDALEEAIAEKLAAIREAIGDEVDEEDN